MNQFPQYAERPASPVQLDSYLDPVTEPRRPSRLRTIAHRAVLIPLAAAGAVGIVAWGAWAGITDMFEHGDAVPVVSSARPTAQPGPPVEHSPKVPTSVDEDGQYIVGKHIKAGTYRATCGGRQTCLWQRYRVLDGLTTAVAGGTASPGESVLVELTTADFSFATLGFGKWTGQ